MRSENAIKTKLHGYYLDETSIFPETQLTIRIQYVSSIRPLKNKKIYSDELIVNYLEFKK